MLDTLRQILHWNIMQSNPALRTPTLQNSPYFCVFKRDKRNPPELLFDCSRVPEDRRAKNVLTRRKLSVFDKGAMTTISTQ